MQYRPEFLDHFRNPRGRGALEGPTHRGEGFDEACRDRMWLDLVVADGRIEKAAYRVEGCVGAIVAGSALVSLLPGRAADPDAVTKEEIEAVVREVPRTKRHALSLALRTLADALR
jgi:NifU-like protein involved in Fe-S cluster formation